jgi:hypothetical protein
VSVSSVVLIHNPGECLLHRSVCMQETTGDLMKLDMGEFYKTWASKFGFYSDYNLKDNLKTRFSIKYEVEREMFETKAVEKMKNILFVCYTFSIRPLWIEGMLCIYFKTWIFSSQSWPEDNCTKGREQKKSRFCAYWNSFMYLIFCLCNDALILIVYSFSRPIEVFMWQLYFKEKAGDGKSHNFP